MDVCVSVCELVVYVFTVRFVVMVKSVAQYWCRLNWISLVCVYVCSHKVVMCVCVCGIGEIKISNNNNIIKKLNVNKNIRY